MAKLIPNSFTSYEFTEKEVIEGQIFTGLQTQMLQNKLSEYAAMKMELTHDPDHLYLSLQKEAELIGQIELLQFLIAQSEATKEMLKEISE